MAINDTRRTTDEWETTVGAQVRAIRIAADLDQSELARRADVSLGAVKNLEAGKGSTLKTLVRTVRALGHTDWLESLAPPYYGQPDGDARVETPDNGSPPARFPTPRLGRAGELMAYVPVEVVEVRAWGEQVGAIALDPGTGYYVFEYAPAWQARGIELAPTTMPLGQGRYVFPFLPVATFHGLPAMLADALPDAFGNALTTAYLVGEGIPTAMITSLDRLAYLASRGLGALEFRPPRGPRPRKSTAIDLAELVVAARSAVLGVFDAEDGITQSVRHLIAVGTSAGGARAKAILAWNPTTGDVRSGQVPAEPGFEQWLLKLDGVGADSDLGVSTDFGRIEFAYSLMAKAAGIEMAPCRLLQEGGRAHFMTRRFDRTDDGARVHTQTLCALAHLDFRLVGAHDYAQLFEIVERLGLGPDTRSDVFRRMVFNVAGANCDDHTKNFSFLLPEGGEWRIAPAYDLTHAHNPQSYWIAQHLMAVNGRTRGIDRSDLATVGDRFEVPDATAIIGVVLDAIDSWSQWADEAGVGAKAAAEVGSDLREMCVPLR